MGFLAESGGDGGVEAPEDVHGFAFGVANIVSGAEVGVGAGFLGKGIVFLFIADKENNFAPLFVVMDIALACGGVFSCRILTLPVEELVGDGIIVVKRRRGVIFTGFFERNQEDVDAQVFGPVDARLEGGGCVVVEGDEELVARVGAVKIEWAFEAKVNGCIDEVDLFSSIAEELLEFIEEDWTVREFTEIGESVRIVAACHGDVPDGDVEHLEHAPVHVRKRLNLEGGKMCHGLQKEVNPTA